MLEAYKRIVCRFKVPDAISEEGLIIEITFEYFLGLRMVGVNGVNADVLTVRFAVSVQFKVDHFSAQ